jgi:hypothetical protein
MPSKGVYFLANDAVYDLAVAFLKSFRIHNPTVGLCLIPYDQESSRLAELAEQYNFTCLADDTLFARCDDLAQRIHGQTYGHYRKLAAWHGPFDEFIYIDSDTVVTGGVAFVYEFLSQYEFIFSHSNWPHLRQWVWKETIYETGALTNAQIEFSANTGFICSRRGSLTIDEAEKRLLEALKIVQHMVLYCIEQPFLNFLIVTSGKPYASLTNIVAETNATNFPLEKWGGEKLKVLRKENCRTLTQNVLLVHWAGVWRPIGAEEWIYRMLRKLGYRGWLPSVRVFMPNGALWRYYRYQPERLFTRRYRSGGC